MRHTSFEPLKQIISDKLMDAAEALPDFNGGPIRLLQSARRTQRRISKSNFDRSKTPEGISIALKTVSFSLSYEFEQFSEIHASLERAFSKNKLKHKTIENIRDRENDMFSSGWTNLCTIAQHRSFYDINPTIITDLPEGISRITISHNRILPSFAFLEVTIDVTDDYAKSIKHTAEKFYLTQITFHKVISFKPFRGYGIKSSNAAKIVIGKKIGKLATDAQERVFNILGLRKCCIKTGPNLCAYEIRAEDNEENLNNVISDKNHWLSKYGFSISPYRNYHFDCFAYSESRIDEKDTSNVLLYLTKRNNTESLFLDDTIRGLLTSSCLYDRVDNLRTSLSKLRARDLRKLRPTVDKLAYNYSSVLELKTTLISLVRIQSEFNKNKSWVLNFLPELSPGYKDDRGTYSEIFSSNFPRYLNAVVDSGVMFDNSVVSQLKLSSLYSMHRLQNRVILLTIFALILTAYNLPPVNRIIKSFFEFAFRFFYSF